MGKTTIGVRDVDVEVFRKFRARAIERKLSLGSALTRALKKYLEEEKDENTGVKNIDLFLSVKPFKWGKNTKKTSQEIDELLYGAKR